MRIGYACLALGVPDADIKSCTLKNADENRLYAITAHNLQALETMIVYNAAHRIGLYRITSDLIPFGSGVAAALPWEDVFSEKLAAIRSMIRQSGIRVSMHPGQYTVLNSPRADVAEKAFKDLEYHARVLDSLGLGTAHKIVLHIGGAYGDKKSAQKRFLSRFADLSQNVKDRLALENDHTAFNIGDVLETAFHTGLPVVYDNLHNAVNPAGCLACDAGWIGTCAQTWQKKDGRQKIHYAQPHPEKRPGAHADTIEADRFLDFYKSQLSGLNVDIMLEVKDKNLSALKCVLCLSDAGIRALEEEWARYKYSVLEKSPALYLQIRALLKDKSRYPVRDFYRMVEAARREPFNAGHALNAAQHVWGYLKDTASAAERERFLGTLDRFRRGDVSLAAVKSQLLRLAQKYHSSVLLNGYYFYI